MTSIFAGSSGVRGYMSQENWRIPRLLQDFQHCFFHGHISASLSWRSSEASLILVILILVILIIVIIIIIIIIHVLMLSTHLACVRVAFGSANGESLASTPLWLMVAVGVWISIVSRSKYEPSWIIPWWALIVKKNHPGIWPLKRMKIKGMLWVMCVAKYWKLNACNLHHWITCIPAG